VDLARQIYLVAEHVATDDLAALASQAVLRLALDELKRAGADNAAAIRTWRAALGPKPWHARVHDAIGATQNTVRAIVDTVEGRYLY
jgi:hypothetical protein